MVLDKRPVASRINMCLVLFLHEVVRSSILIVTIPVASSPSAALVVCSRLSSSIASRRLLTYLIKITFYFDDLSVGLHRLLGFLLYYFLDGGIVEVLSHHGIAWLRQLQTLNWS